MFREIRPINSTVLRCGLAALALAAASVSLSGCGGASTTGQARAAGNSQTLTIAQPSAPLTLDGSLDSATVDRNVFAAVYDTLLQWKWHGNQATLAPDLATSWKATAPDTWRLTLRRGVTWQNGAPFTAADVQFTIERALNPKNKSSEASFYSVIKDVRILNPYSVDIDTLGPQATLPARLALYPMVPKNYLTKVGGAAFGQHPVGTGPYEFSSYTPDEHLILVANPHYWGETPHFKKVVFDFIPSDASRVQALESGGVDLAVNLPPDSLKTLSGSAGLRTASVKVDRSSILYFDTVHGGPLANQQVRQAINYAIDRQGIISSLLDGLAQPISSTVVPGFVGYDTAIRPYPYDPARARTLLAQAGYPHGFTLTLRHTNGYYPADTLVAQAIEADLNKVGIKTSDQGSESAVYFSDFLDQYTKAGSPPTAFLGGWGAPVFDSGINWSDTLGGGDPVKLWKNRQFASLVTKGLATMNTQARARIYYQAQQIMFNQAPVGFLWQISDSFGMNSRLQWTPRPDELASPQDMSLR